MAPGTGTHVPPGHWAPLAQGCPFAEPPEQVPPMREQAGVVSTAGCTSSHSKTTSSIPTP